jgi:hypothetical protein
MKDVAITKIGGYEILAPSGTYLAEVGRQMFQ